MQYKVNDNWVVVLVVGLVLPPILSMLFALYKFCATRNRVFGLIFSFFGVLFLTYNFFSIDNCSRCMDAIASYSVLPLDPLTSLMQLGINYLPLQCSHFIFIYILLIYIFLLFTLDKVHRSNWSIPAIFIFLSIISLRNSMDLLYYSLSITFVLFFITNIKKISLIKCLILIAITYLLHPGVLIILLPSIALCYVISRYNNNLTYYLALMAIYVLFYILSHTTISAVGMPEIDSIIASFNSYTSNQYWGTRKGDTAIHGITYTIIYYVIPFTYFILFIYTLKYRHIIKDKFVLAIFQVTILFYPNFINFVTLTERALVVLSVTSVLCAISLIRTNKTIITMNFLVFYCALIFLFNITKWMGPISLHNVFKPNSYEEIRLYSYYVPSLYLLDYGTYGYSDEFLQKNTYITF